MSCLILGHGVPGFITSVTSLLNEVHDEQQNIKQDRNRCEFFANRILSALRHIYNIVVFCERSTSFQEETVAHLKLLSGNLKSLYSDICSLPAMNSYSYRPVTERSGQRGRPRFTITSEQLQCLRSEYNNWADIARDLGVSRQTIYNRRHELGFSLDFERYSLITEDQLDSVVRAEQQEFPGTGETNMIGGLRRRGIFVQRWRVRESIQRMDPIGAANRWAQRIVRRPYSVPHPNFLWHIDSHMKLCHWRICIHGCVDRYSRCVIYLDVHNNNRATTVLESFQEATNTWGHPSRVRADDGGENVAIGEYITWFRGVDQGSFLTGPSVRNTRIERLWRDVGEGVVSVYRHLFLHMEEQNVLNASQDVDMFALHYIFLPRIQRSLDAFRERFNFHSLSTARNRTPWQLWASGCLQNHTSPNSGVRDIFDTDIPADLQFYGDDPDAPLPSLDDEMEGVTITPVNFEFQEEYLQVMRTTFQPLEDDGNYGINTFCQVKEFLTQAVEESQQL